MAVILARHKSKGRGKALPRETVLKLARLAKLRRDLVLKETNLSKYMKKLTQKMAEKQDEPVMVKVKKVVYSGTNVMVGGFTYPIREDIQGKATFVLNEEKHVVEILR